MSSTNWNLDATHSEVTFKVKHLVISTVSGKFNAFNSSVSSEGNDLQTAKVNFQIEAASIDTGLEARNQHLQSNDFFNAEAFPLISFQSDKIRQIDGNEYEVDGQLTIRDVTKPATFKVEYGGVAQDFYGQTKLGVEVEGKIKRSEFNLSWNAITEAGNVVVSDEVKFQANLQYVKQ